MKLTDDEIQKWLEGPSNRSLTHEEHSAVEDLALQKKLGQGNVDTLSRLIERAEELELSALLVAAIDPRVRECIAILRGALKSLDEDTATD